MLGTSCSIADHSDAQDEKFALMFRFSGQYPIDAPAVQFVVGPLDGDAGGVYKAPGRSPFSSIHNLNHFLCIPISTKMDMCVQVAPSSGC